MSDTTNLPAHQHAGRSIDQFRPEGRSLRIKTLPLQLPEIGKIKIGRKGQMRRSGQGNEFQPPQKLDHFLVTTLERGEDNNFIPDRSIHGQLGDKPRDLPVRLVFDDPELNFQSRLVCYRGKTLWCHGDGIMAQRLQQDGTWKEHNCAECPLADPAFQAREENQRYPKCKMNGKLAVMVDMAQTVGGVHVLRTTSYNTIVGINSSLLFLSSITGGPLASLPLNMSIRPKTATAPDGKTQTIYVVSLGFRGSMEQLQESAHRVALTRERNRQRIELVEQEARLMLMAPTGTGEAFHGDDDVTDVVEEFYPEAAVEAAADQPPPPPPPPPAKPPRAAAPAASAPAEASPPPPPPPAEVAEITDADGGEDDGPFADYELVTLDGEVLAFTVGQEVNFSTAFITELRNAAKVGRTKLDGMWESNANSLDGVPVAVAKEITEEHKRLITVLEREAAKAAEQPAPPPARSRRAAPAAAAAAEPPPPPPPVEEEQQGDQPPAPPPDQGSDDLF